METVRTRAGRYCPERDFRILDHARMRRCVGGLVVIMNVLYLDDVVACGDNDGEAFVKGLATAPPRVPAPAGVVAHETMLVDHENRPTVHFAE